MSGSKPPPAQRIVSKEESTYFYVQLPEIWFQKRKAPPLDPRASEKSWGDLAREHPGLSICERAPWAAIVKSQKIISPSAFKKVVGSWIRKSDGLLKIKPGCKRLVFENVLEAPRRPGIYFIWDGDEIVYIGKASAIRERLKWHMIGKAMGMFGTWTAETMESQVWDALSPPMPMQNSQELKRPIPYGEMCELMLYAMMSCFSFSCSEGEKNELKAGEKWLIRLFRPKYNLQYL